MTMNKLEMLKIKKELSAVVAGKDALEFSIADKMSEIERLQESLKVQDAKVAELQEKFDACGK